MESESERILICEARGDVYAPVPLIGEAEEEDRTEQSQLAWPMTGTHEGTDQYVQRMVAAEANRKKRLQQGSTSEVPAGACACCREPTPQADRVYCNTCNQMACRTCFGEWTRKSTNCMYCRQTWRKRKKQWTRVKGHLNKLAV